MDIQTQSQPKYDIPTAITFLIAGLGLGSVLTLLFASRFDEPLLISPGERQHAPE